MQLRVWAPSASNDNNNNVYTALTAVVPDSKCCVCVNYLILITTLRSWWGYKPPVTYCKMSTETPGGAKSRGRV